ncbi:MAG: hypothetical protein PHW73_01045 [Atribacterota bacterium]|nr:hypothetical protein [Atribacterota bacterium]
MWFYAAIEGDPNPDRKMSYTNLVQFMSLKNNVRAVGNKVVTVGENIITWQIAGVDAPMASVDYSVQIFDPNGIGIQLTDQTADDITIDCLTEGVIHVIATLNT